MSVHPLRSRKLAETIFINGNIYTVNDKQPFAQAIAAKGDRIIFVGANSWTPNNSGATKPRIVDLAGKTVTPGFTDSHCHIFGIGEREMHFESRGDEYPRQIFSRRSWSASRKQSATKKKWKTGRGWIETFWKPPHISQSALISTKSRRTIPFS